MVNGGRSVVGVSVGGWVNMSVCRSAGVWTTRCGGVGFCGWFGDPDLDGLLAAVGRGHWSIYQYVSIRHGGYHGMYRR